MVGPGTFRLVGLDPVLRHTGWGIIDVSGNRLSHVANGAIHSDGDLSLAERLVQLHDGLTAVIERWQPDEAAVTVSIEGSVDETVTAILSALSVTSG